LIEAQVGAESVKDVLLSEVGAERGILLTSDRFVADSDQIAGQRTVRDEAWDGYLLGSVPRCALRAIVPRAARPSGRRSAW
jgi:hypothetical protein